MGDNVQSEGHGFKQYALKDQEKSSFCKVEVNKVIHSYFEIHEKWSGFYFGDKNNSKKK